MILNHKSQQILSASTKVTSEIIATLSKAQKKVLNKLIESNSKYLSSYISQSTLGKEAKVTREHSNRSVAVLEEAGLITTEYRHMKTCLYKVSDEFNKYEVRKQLSHLLPALRLIPFIWMLPIQTEKITQVNLFNLVISSYPVHSPSILPRTIDYRSCKKDGREEKHKKRNVMEQFELPSYVREITELDLTDYGYIRLSCFPEGAIKQARKAIGRTGEIGQPFNYFIKICRNWCTENNIAVNYTNVGALARALGFTEATPELNSNTITRTKTPVARKEIGKPQETTVLSSIERFKKTKDIEATKPQKTEDEKVAEIKYQLERCYINLDKANESIYPDIAKSFIVSEINQLTDKLIALGRNEHKEIRDKAIEVVYADKVSSEQETGICFDENFEEAYSSGYLEEIYDPIEI